MSVSSGFCTCGDFDAEWLDGRREGTEGDKKGATVTRRRGKGNEIKK